jgi:hypothetical protein
VKPPSAPLRPRALGQVAHALVDADSQELGQKILAIRGLSWRNRATPPGAARHRW